jgi:hypothetical protein
VNGYILTLSGRIIENYGQKTAMLFRGYTQVLVPSTLALLAVGSGLWQVHESRECLYMLKVFTGVLSDATKSVSRAYINNFQDKSKQIAIDMFLVIIARSC